MRTSISSILMVACISFDSLIALAGSTDITLYTGFVSKVRCEGRLMVSAVGDSTLVQLQALPKEMGCAVLLKPLGSTGKTNLILETSTGSITRIVRISSVVPDRSGRLEWKLKGDQK